MISAMFSAWYNSMDIDEHFFSEAKQFDTDDDVIIRPINPLL